MARPVSTILQSLVGKLPIGWALGKRGGVLDTLFSAAAGGIVEVEESAEALMTETDPRKANALLSDFERCLGPDPCGRDLDGLSVEQRRKLAHQRWTSKGGQSIPYFISVAAKLGVDITIEEFWPNRAGVLRAGTPVREQGVQFVWRVNIPGLVTVTKFRAGASAAGNFLGWFELSSIECEIRRIAPAHTKVVFAYGET